MNFEILLWLAVAVVAASSLFAMMRRRQLHLVRLLKEHVERQTAWQRRLQKGAELAAQADAAEQGGPVGLSVVRDE
jgi:hypothetical protein